MTKKPSATMNYTRYPRAKSIVIITIGLSGATPADAAQANTPEKNGNDTVPVELSPFIVQEDASQGYYASQTLAGGRLRQDIKDIGASIQVVTKGAMALTVDEIIALRKYLLNAGFLLMTDSWGDAVLAHVERL